MLDAKRVLTVSANRPEERVLKVTGPRWDTNYLLGFSQPTRREGTESAGGVLRTGADAGFSQPTRREGTERGDAFAMPAFAMPVSANRPEERVLKDRRQRCDVPTADVSANRPEERVLKANRRYPPQNRDAVSANRPEERVLKGYLFGKVLDTAPGFSQPTRREGTERRAADGVTTTSIGSFSQPTRREGTERPALAVGRAPPPLVSANRPEERVLKDLC